jgi:hypothetical protein
MANATLFLAFYSFIDIAFRIKVQQRQEGGQIVNVFF